MQDIIAIYKQVGRTLWHLIAIAERGREGIVVFDLNRVIQFVNVAWAVMHGYKTTDELIGKQISAFHTEEQMASDVVPFIEETEQRGQFAGRLGHVRRDRTPFFTEMLMVVFNDDAGRAMGLIGFAADITGQERKEEELRQYRCHMEELVKQQTAELTAANEQLQYEIAEREQAGQEFRQQTAELSAANERLREQIGEQERAKDELEKHRDKLKQRLKQQSAELTAANEQLQYEIAEREQAGQEFRQQTAELSAANERLREQIGEQERAKDELEKHRDKLEQHLKQQSDELMAVEAQLKDEITKRKKEGEYFKQRADAIKAAGERLRTQIDELSARGPVDESDMLKATDSVKAAASITDGEKAVLENVFRQNVVLQRPKLGSTAKEDS